MNYKFLFEKEQEISKLVKEELEVKNELVERYLDEPLFSKSGRLDLEQLLGQINETIERKIEKMNEVIFKKMNKATRN